MDTQQDAEPDGTNNNSQMKVEPQVILKYCLKRQSRVSSIVEIWNFGTGNAFLNFFSFFREMVVTMKAFGQLTSNLLFKNHFKSTLHVVGEK